MSIWVIESRRRYIRGSHYEPDFICDARSKEEAQKVAALKNISINFQYRAVEYVRKELNA